MTFLYGSYCSGEDTIQKPHHIWSPLDSISGSIRVLFEGFTQAHQRKTRAHPSCRCGDERKQFKYFLFIVLAFILFPTGHPDDAYDDPIGTDVIGANLEAILETQLLKNTGVPALNTYQNDNVLLSTMPRLLITFVLLGRVSNILATPRPM